MAVEVFTMDQGSADWFAARLGIPTASEFATVLSEGRADGTMPNAMLDALVKSGVTAEQLAAAVKAAKSKNSNPAAVRRTYMMKLAGEVLTGQPQADGYLNADMERGRDQEAEARDLYALKTGEEPQIVGFIKNGAKGCSPDSLIGTDGGLEIKSAAPHIQIERLLRGALPSEHVAQVQGSMWVAERSWWDFVSYCPALPMFVLRVQRDDAYCARLDKAVPAFNEELEAMVQTIRSYGGVTRLAA